MLRELSGQAHTVTTGVCIRTGSPAGNRSCAAASSRVIAQPSAVASSCVIAGSTGNLPAMESFTDSSLVHFAELTDADIAYYVDRYKPYDKAGAYGIQEWIGAAAITRIEGSYYNVMGLPTAPLWAHLKKYLSTSL